MNIYYQWRTEVNDDKHCKINVNYLRTLIEWSPTLLSIGNLLNSVTIIVDIILLELVIPSPYSSYVYDCSL